MTTVTTRTRRNTANVSTSANEQAPANVNEPQAPVVEQQAPANEQAPAQAPATMDKRLALAVLQEYETVKKSVIDAHVNIGKIVSSISPNEETYKVMLATALSAQGYTANVDDDIANAASKIVRNGKTLLELLPIAQTVTTDKAVLLARELEQINALPEFRTVCRSLMTYVNMYKAACAKHGIDASYTIVLEGEQAPAIVHRSLKTGHKRSTSANTNAATGERKVRRFDALSANLDIPNGNMSGYRIALKTGLASANVEIFDKEGNRKAFLGTFRSNSAARGHNPPMATVAEFINRTIQALTNTNSRARLADIFPSVPNLYDVTSEIVSQAPEQAPAK